MRGTEARTMEEHMREELGLQRETELCTTTDTIASQIKEIPLKDIQCNY
jgi:hypothetical protein